MRRKKLYKWLGGGLAVLLALFLGVEIVFRVFYPNFPFSLRTTISGVRIWGLGGAPLGELANNYNQYCAGDERLYARLLPDLDEARVRIGRVVYNLTTTSLGFEDIGFRTEETNGKWDGVVLGDSMAFCWGVQQEDCWVDLLAESTGFELANLGVVGTGSVSHLHYLEDYGLALDPEIVIWQFSSNDMVDDFDHVVNKGQGCPHWQDAEHASEEKAFKGLRNWLSRTFVTYNLVFAPAMRTIFPDLAGKAERHVPYEQVVTTDNQKLLAWMGNPPKDDPRSVKGMQLTKEAILAAATEARENNRLFVLMLPPSSLLTYIDVLPSESLIAKARIEEAQFEELIAFAEENGIEYIDLRPQFEGQILQGRELFSTEELHWSEEGNRFVAESLAGWLVDRLSAEAGD